MFSDRTAFKCAPVVASVKIKTEYRILVKGKVNRNAFCRLNLNSPSFTTTTTIVGRTNTL
jgi:hypothetical protein